MIENNPGVLDSMVYAEGIKNTVFLDWNEKLSKRKVKMSTTLGQVETWIFLSGDLANFYSLGEKQLGMDDTTKKVLSKKVRMTNFREQAALFQELLAQSSPKFYPEANSVKELREVLKDGMKSRCLGDTADRNEVIELEMPLGSWRTLVTSMAYQVSTMLTISDDDRNNLATMADNAEFACRSLADILPQLKEAGVKVDNKLLGDTLLIVNVLDAM